ncbi:hypothetical protein [Nocardioides sp.]|uniref:hypothetical protein n=1 Tax=Nocardioides sp. TaxID=35761 RepID=UPI00378310DC
MPRSQLLLRGVVLLGPVVALLATGPAGHWPPWWLLVPVVAGAGVAAAAPDSAAPAGVGLGVLAWWTVALGDGVPAAVLVAAPALLAAHLAALLASYGPAAMPLDAATLRLWGRRGALVLLTVPAAFVAVRLLDGEPEQPGIWVLGVAAACVATVVATALIDVRTGEVDAR